jgi:hypothetical protein
MVHLRHVAVAVSAALVFGVALAQPAAAQGCPSWNNPTVFGAVTLDPGFLPDPNVVTLTAGGTVDLAGCIDGTAGYVVTQPDFRLIYNGTSPTGILSIALEASSNVDTVLLINAPDGSWHFNDDYRDLNSALVFRDPMPGQYDIWAGSYDRSTNSPAKLIITEYEY